jgi:putative ABC transport system permease protein
MVAAFAVYLGITTVAAGIIRAETGVVLEPFAWQPIFVVVPVTMVGLSALAGVIPAVKAYRTNVAENLVPVS